MPCGRRAVGDYRGMCVQDACSLAIHSETVMIRIRISRERECSSGRGPPGCDRPNAKKLPAALTYCDRRANVGSLKQILHRDGMTPAQSSRGESRQRGLKRAIAQCAADLAPTTVHMPAAVPRPGHAELPLERTGLRIPPIPFCPPHTKITHTSWTTPWL
jgi:hypothetical protein